MATIQDLKAQLDLLAEYIPVTSNLEISKAWKIPPTFNENKDKYPNSDLPGIYFFTNDQDEIIYIGKASNGLGTRIGNGYLGKIKVRKNDKIQHAKSLYTIKLEWNLFFLAPAIEEFLIYRLDPNQNVIGRRRGSEKLDAAVANMLAPTVSSN